MVNKTIKKDSTTVLAFLLTVMCLMTAQYSMASENGKQVFQKKCVGCHPAGKGYEYAR